MRKNEAYAEEYGICGEIQHIQKNTIHSEEGENMKTLREVKIGETARVLKLQGEGAIRRRIMDMGITKGVEIYVRKVAPLGDPVEITVRGYELSVRKADAEMILVQ
jgi:ferrous iron transport protein A